MRQTDINLKGYIVDQMEKNVQHYNSPLAQLGDGIVRNDLPDDKNEFKVDTMMSLILVQWKYSLSTHHHSQLRTLAAKTRNITVTIRGLLDHYIHFLAGPDRQDLIELRNNMVEYDSDGLIDLPYRVNFFNSTKYYFPMIGSIDSSTALVIEFVKILESPALINDIGDRLRFWRFDQHVDVNLLGITAGRVADMIMNHPACSKLAFTNLKSPRMELINFLKKDCYLIYYYDGEEIYEDVDDLFRTYKTLMLGGSTTVYNYIGSLIITIYFSRYRQWLNRIRLGGTLNLPKFTVHPHTLLMDVHEGLSADMSEIDWKAHPKDNFRGIIERIERDRLETLKITKPLEIRSAVNIPDVKELVTGVDMAQVGDMMNICIGGNHYVSMLPRPNCHYFKLGTGAAEDCIAAEFKRYDTWVLQQAVTDSNHPVDNSHPQKSNLDKLIEFFNAKTYALNNTPNYVTEIKLSRAIIAMMQPSLI